MANKFPNSDSWDLELRLDLGQSRTRERWESIQVKRPWHRGEKRQKEVEGPWWASGLSNETRRRTRRNPPRFQRLGPLLFRPRTQGKPSSQPGGQGGTWGGSPSARPGHVGEAALEPRWVAGDPRSPVLSDASRERLGCVGPLQVQGVGELISVVELGSGRMLPGAN